MNTDQKSEMRYELWTDVLLWANYLMLLVGLLVAFAGNSRVLDWHNEGTYEAFNQGKQLSGQVLELKNWLFGIIGATMAGFNIMAVFVIRFALKKKALWAWNALFYGIVVWFIIDSGISYYYAAYYNIYWINIPALLAFLVPLYGTRKAVSRQLPSVQSSEDI